MSTTQKRSSVGCFRLSISLFFSFLLFCGFLFATFVFIITLVIAVQAARLPLSGIRTQATIVDVESVTCGKHYTPAHNYTVQFTDRAGHVQNSSLSCETFPTLSRGDSITIVYYPDDPSLIALPDEVGAFPIAGVIVALLFGLIDLSMLACFILWVRHEKDIIGPRLTRRNRADPRQPRVAEQVMFAHPVAGSYIDDEKWASEQEQPEPSLAHEFPPQASQLELFDAQDAQEEKPSEQ